MKICKSCRHKKKPEEYDTPQGWVCSACKEIGRKKWYKETYPKRDKEKIRELQRKNYSKRAYKKGFGIW